MPVTCTAVFYCPMSENVVTEKEHTGIMVALFLPLVIAQGVASLYRDQFDLNATITPANELHITLMYLGDTGETTYDAGQLSDWLAEWARGQQPIKGKLNGVGKFNSESPEGVPVYLSYDSPELPAFRQSLVGFFQSKGLRFEFNHGFTPHITLAYTPNYKDGWLIDVPQQEITFNEVVLAYGGNRFVAPLGNQSGFFVTKDAQGNDRWVLISSSAYVDRDGEIVTEKALQKAVERMDATGDYGELRWWHTGVVLGKADYAAVYAHQLIESGTFVSKAVAESVKAAAGTLGASIGFRHPPTQPTNKEYHDIAIVERSLLPRGKESNLYTRLSVAGGTMKELSAEKRAGLIAVLGEDEANAHLAVMERTAKEADEAGLIRKESKGWFQRLKEAFAAIPDPNEEDELDLDDDATDELEVPAEKKEAKSKKSDDADEDDTPMTRGEFKASMAKFEAKMTGLLGERQKETDTLATKEEVAQVAAAVTPVVTIQKETVERLGQVEKQVQTLVGETLPRGMAGIFRASVEGSAATDKAAEQAKTLKAQQTRDPLETYLDERLGA